MKPLKKSKAKRPGDLQRKRVDFVMTIGHGSRPLAEFLQILQKHGVSQILDVRKMPRSIANPQFNYETLPLRLAEAGIDYRHIPGLTGLRRPSQSSPNKAWRNKSFQAYADYMQTAKFRDEIDQLVEVAGERAVALMCAETVPWRCHRSLIADALLARGVAVLHLLSQDKTMIHFMNAMARLDGKQVSYPE